jgi:hypothetical protein
MGKESSDGQFQFIKISDVKSGSSIFPESNGLEKGEAVVGDSIGVVKLVSSGGFARLVLCIRL